MWLLGLYPVSFTTYRRWTYTQCVGIIRFHANGLWANTPNGSALLAATLVPTHRVLVSTSCCGLGSKIIGIKPFRIKPIDPKPYSSRNHTTFRGLGFGLYGLIRIGWTLGGGLVQPPSRTYLSHNSVPVRPVHLYIITDWVYKIKKIFFVVLMQ